MQGVSLAHGSDVMRDVFVLQYASQSGCCKIRALKQGGLCVVQDTREGMLTWLALALQSNAERGKMQMDPRKAANHSFFISLNAVLLKLCEPFLEPLSGKAWGKVDPR